MKSSVNLTRLLLLVAWLIFDHAGVGNLRSSPFFRPKLSLGGCIVLLSVLLAVFAGLFTRAGGLYSLLVLMLSHELPQDTNVVTLVLQKVEAIHPAEPQLQQVVVERFLRDTDQFGRIFERVAHSLAIPELDPVVELSPKGNTLYNKSDLPFLSSLQVCLK